MSKFFKWILEHKAIVSCLFVLILALSIVGYMMVDVNSDVTSYLPEDSDTAIGKDKLESSFGIIGEGRVGLTNVDKDIVIDIVKKIESYSVVKQVAWIGSFDSMKNEIENPNTTPGIRDALKESYAVLEQKFYKSASNTFIVAIYYNEANSDDGVIKSLDDIEAYINSVITTDGEYYIDGGAANARSLLKSSLGEMPKYLIVAVIFILIILLITSKSFFEPLIFLVTLGVSILINMGSNIVLGEISSITFSASAILQLALTMDYSIFLMHSYYEELETSLDTKQALIRALPKTLKAVSSSALTTIGGFIALFTMKFGMGLDLGAVLAKGVAFSLLTVMILQPILISACQKVVKKTQHKEIKVNFTRFAKFTTTKYKPLLIISLILIIPCFLLQFKVPLNYLTMTAPSKTTTTTQDVMSAESNQLIIVLPCAFKDPTSNEKHYSFLNDVKKIKNVTEVFSMYSIVNNGLMTGGILTNNPLIDEVGKIFVSGNYTLYTITIGVKEESAESYQVLKEVKETSKKYFNNIYVTGLSQGAYDLSVITPQDFALVSIFSALLILIILILTFRSLSLSAILLFVIELGIWINLSIVYIFGSSLNFMSYIIISSIQLGATVDYAILMACKYREAAKTMARVEAVKEGVKKACPAILISASVLIAACLAVNIITTNLIVGEITQLITRGALLSVLFVTFLLPGILTLQAKHLDRKDAKKSDKTLAVATDVTITEAKETDITGSDADTKDSNSETIEAEYTIN